MLFLALLLAGILPMAVSSFLLVSQNREVLEEQELDLLVAEAVGRSQELSDRLVSIRKQLSEVGHVLAATALSESSGREPAELMVDAPWVHGVLERIAQENPGQLLTVAALDLEGSGPSVGSTAQGRSALEQGFLRATETRQPAYSFAVLPGGEPVTAVAVPVPPPAAALTGADGEAAPLPVAVVVALVRLPALSNFFADREADLDGVEAALLDGEGNLLWSRGIPEEQVEPLLKSNPVRALRSVSVSGVGQYTLEIDGKPHEMLLQRSSVEEPGWHLVAQTPRASAFQAADRLVINTLAASLLVVLLALVLAAVAARRVSDPVQRLAETSHGIAAGDFKQRVETGGLTYELAELADDFNRMSGHVERYVDELKRAAQANRELFIGSLRAFAAAIDAKDPYTRGHSERVASLSRAIARHLGSSEDLQHQVWIAALLHDVGKIGVDDRILKKGGVLSDDEFAQMKMHTIIGAEILNPIVELREIIPAVRWHHENWNGRGYPDRLKGEQIPLLARIVAVADTFDAVTTNRPYQQAYSLDDAVATIRRLVGSRFDAKIVTAFLRAYERGDVRAPRETSQPARAAVGA
jgi:putative nucleotidyltransferase with HDIG domain